MLFDIIDANQGLDDAIVRQNKCKSIEQKAAKLKQKLNETEMKIKEVIFNKELRLRSKSSEPLSQSIYAAEKQKIVKYDTVSRAVAILHKLLAGRLQAQQFQRWK